MKKRLGIGQFARYVLQRPLYKYQEDAGDAILDSIFTGKGLTFTIMFARQMGKNQLSAVIEAYLLFCMNEGTIVKAAPTSRPQAVNSSARLSTMLNTSWIKNRVWQDHGYVFGVAPTGSRKDKYTGPGIFFFSASPEASIVGATASLLLEVDEAQDVSIEKFDRDLRPMASTTNATTVLYGTAWTDNTLLATVRAHNLALEQQDGIKRHFEYDWTVLGAINSSYKQFVEGEIARLGMDHPSIRTQYRLLPISGAGMLLSDMQQQLLQGQHSWETEPDGTSIYIAGMDVGGEERPTQGNMTPRAGHDSTVITIGKITYNELDLPRIEIVHHYSWTGKRFQEQYAEAVTICEHWGVSRLVIDKTGIGEGMASLLTAKLGGERVQPFHFTRPSKSKLTYHFMNMVNAGRLKLYQRARAVDEVYTECWKQLKLARYHRPAVDVMTMYVDALDGHDDFLMSLALTCEALRDGGVTPATSQVILPRSLYSDGNY